MNKVSKTKTALKLQTESRKRTQSPDNAYTVAHRRKTTRMNRAIRYINGERVAVNVGSTPKKTLLQIRF